MVSTQVSIVVAIVLLNLCSCLCDAHVLNNNSSSKYNSGSGVATWYGEENGAGSGGACGFNNDVKYPPFSAFISAGNPNIFLKGKGCGHCFAVSCNTRPYCSGKEVWVTVTDECPGCNKAPFQFDLSGTAFGALAWRGQEHNLRNLGQVNVNFRRVQCSHGNAKIAFTISNGSNPNWFAVALEYANGDGGFKSVEIAPGGTPNNFNYMTNLWGAIWQRNIDPSVKGPFSFRLTSGDGKIIVARNVIPQGFVNGRKYWSNVNF